MILIVLAVTASPWSISRPCPEEALSASVASAVEWDAATESAWQDVDVYGIQDAESITLTIGFRFAPITDNQTIRPLLYCGDVDSGTALAVYVGHLEADNHRLYATRWRDPQPLMEGWDSVTVDWCYNSAGNVTADEWHTYTLTVSEAGNTGYLDGVEMTDREYNYGDSPSNECLSGLNPTMVLLGRGYFPGRHEVEYVGTGGVVVITSMEAE